MSTKDIVIVIDSLQNRIQKYPQLGNKKDKFYNLLENIKNEYKKLEVPDNLLDDKLTHGAEILYQVGLII